MLGEGGSPTLSPGTDAGRVCPKALHDAEPTKHTQPFTRERGLGIGIEDKHFFEKTYFFYSLKLYLFGTAFSFSLTNSNIMSRTLIYCVKTRTRGKQLKEDYMDFSVKKEPVFVTEEIQALS